MKSKKNVPILRKPVLIDETGQTEKLEIQEDE
jgi:hypothetical protein